MSQPTTPAPPAGGSKSVFTRMWGPLPGWAWAAIGLGLAVIIAVWRKNKAAAANATTTGTLTQVPGNNPDVIFQSYVTPQFFPPAGGRPFPPAGPSPAPQGEWVTVSKWTSDNPSWDSTLRGIAQQKYGSGDQWSVIWNAPENAQLKARRKQPTEIQPGDKVWIPALVPQPGTPSTTGGSTDTTSNTGGGNTGGGNTGNGGTDHSRGSRGQDRGAGNNRPSRSTRNRS